MNSKKIYSAIGRVTSVYDFLATFTGYKKSVEYFLSQLPFAQDETIRVLDAGCGTGVYSFTILERYKNATVTAFDLDEKLVSFVQKVALEKKQEARITVFRADISGPLTELKDEQFDVVITAGVLVYVPHEATVKNLSRFLRSGGYFFNSPNRDSPWGRFICRLYDCTPYPKEENISVFENNGFILVDNIQVPKTPTASFKDAHLFRKK